MTSKPSRRVGGIDRRAATRHGAPTHWDYWAGLVAFYVGEARRQLHRGMQDCDGCHPFDAFLDAMWRIHRCTATIRRLRARAERAEAERDEMRKVARGEGGETWLTY